MMRLINLKNPRQNIKNALTFDKAIRSLKGKQKVLNSFKSKIFLIGKQTQGKGIKILTPTQMVQRLSIALAQV